MMRGDDLDRDQRAPANFGSVGIYPQYRNQGDDDGWQPWSKKSTTTQTGCTVEVRTKRAQWGRGDGGTEDSECPGKKRMKKSTHNLRHRHRRPEDGATCYRVNAMRRTDSISVESHPWNRMVPAPASDHMMTHLQHPASSSSSPCVVRPCPGETGGLMSAVVNSEDNPDRPS